jgi:O-antigen ligase
MMLDLGTFTIQGGGDYRGYSDYITLLLPFALVTLKYPKSITNNLVYLLIFLSFIITFSTGARGAYLAIGITIIFWLIIKKDWYSFITFIGMTFFTLIIGYILIDPNTFAHIFQTSTSGRSGSGTWGIAWDLIKIKPLTGFGYGSEIFVKVFNENLSVHNHWLIKNPIGAHNIFLTMWLYGGIFLFLSFILLNLNVVKELIYYSKSKRMEPRDLLSIAILLSFLSEFTVRGFFEDVQLEILGIYFGILLSRNYLKN